MADAGAVVRDYLQGKAGQNEADKARAVVRSAAGEIVAELPDGFTARDVRACVATLLEGNTDTAELSTNARGRAVTNALNNLVSDGQLSFVEGDGGKGGSYRHADPTNSPQVPVGL